MDMGGSDASVNNLSRCNLTLLELWPEGALIEMTQSWPNASTETAGAFRNGASERISWLGLDRPVRVGSFPAMQRMESLYCTGLKIRRTRRTCSWNWRPG